MWDSLIMEIPDIVYISIGFALFGPILAKLLIFLSKRKMFGQILPHLVTGLILLSSFIPFSPSNTKIYSIYQYALEGNLFFLVMMLAYLLSLLLYFFGGISRRKMAFYLFAMGYICTWVGSRNFAYLVYPIEYGSYIQNLSRLWLVIYILLPILNIVLFIPNFWATGKLKKGFKDYLKNPGKYS